MLTTQTDGPVDLNDIALVKVESPFARTASIIPIQLLPDPNFYPPGKTTGNLPNLLSLVKSQTNSLTK
jgi:hypothetical protein